MSHRPTVLSATMQKKIVGQKTKKNKRKWINLKDRSQRWSHEKKLRDIRARAALKRQRRKEGVEEDSEPGNSSYFQKVTEEDGRSWKTQRSYFSSVPCFSEGCGSLAADPEEFLERLYNPSYKKEKRNVEEEGRARQKAKAVSAKEKESGRSTAAVQCTVDESVGKKDGRKSVSFSKEQDSDSSSWKKQKATPFSTAADRDIDDSYTRTKKKHGKRKEQDQQAHNDEDDELHHGEDEGEHSEEVEIEHSDHDMREAEATDGRRRKSRRLAFYSPQSLATYQAEHCFWEEKEEEERKRRVVDLLKTKDKCNVKGLVLKTAAQGSVGDGSTSVKVTSDESAAGVKSRDSFTNRRMSKLNRMIREEMRLRNKEGESQGQPPVSVCKNTEDSSESQRSLPKGVFYPFRNAMKEAARRKAAQEEGRKRREEEKQIAEKEKEICRRKRAKHRRQLVARTSRGQPVMKNVMQHLLDKITKSL